MNREEIKKILPHREPMLLLDESERKGDTVYSKYTIRETDESDASPHIRDMVEQTWQNVQNSSTTANFYGNLETRSQCDEEQHNYQVEASESM